MSITVGGRRYERRCTCCERIDSSTNDTKHVITVSTRVCLCTLKMHQHSGVISKTSTKGTMDPEGSACNSCNSWPLYAR